MRVIILLSFVAVQTLPARRSPGEDFAGQTVVEYSATEDFNVGGSGFTQTFHPSGLSGDGSPSVVIDVPVRGEKNWSVVHHSPVSTVAVQKGDRIVYELTARVTGDPTDAGDIGVYAESARPGDWSGRGGRMALTTEKRTYRRSVEAADDYGVGEMRLSIHLSPKAQTVEYFGAKVEVFPADAPASALRLDGITWPGQSADAPWRAAAETRIDRLRCQDMRVSVHDADGRPVSGATVRAELKRHRWRFGTFVGSKMLADTEDGRRYREAVLDRFNFVTLPAYLADWGWLSDDARRDYFRLADWARSHGLPARGHLLVYPGWSSSPGRWFDLPKDELRRRLEDHIPRAIAAFESRGVTEWDVTNELRFNEEFMAEIGGLEIAADWFKTARRLLPDGTLYLNETFVINSGGNTETEQAKLVSHFHTLRDAGALIDGIGLQGHFDAELTPPERVIEILDRMAKLTGRIMITEMDMDNEDKAAQADYLRDFYTACFSHPAVEGIVRWGFWEGDMWRARGYDVARDWTEAPGGRMHRHLVKEKWHTDVTQTTGQDGEFRVRGYKGSYDVTVSHDGYTVTIPIELGDGPLEQVVVVPGSQPEK